MLLKLLLAMAIAFGRSAAFSGAGASPRAATITVNAGETVVVHISFDPTTLACTGVTDNGAGGGSVYTKRGEKTQGGIKTETWSTDAGGAKAATSVSATFSGGAATDAGIIPAAYTGVLGIGPYVSGGAVGANPSLTLVTQDANNFLAAGFAGLSGGAFTAFAGTNFRQVDSDITIDQCFADSTVASPGSLTAQVTRSSGTWAGGGIELRTVAGGSPAAYPVGTWKAPAKAGPYDPKGFLLSNFSRYSYIPSVVAAAPAAVIPANPVVSQFASHFVRQLAASVFAVHNFVGHAPLPRRPVDSFPVTAQIRTGLAKVRSVVGPPRFVNPSPVNARWTHPVVASIKTPLPTVHPVVGRQLFRAAQSKARPVVQLVRLPLPKTKSVVESPRFVNPSPVNARWTHPVTAETRTPFPKVRSVVGLGRITPPAPSGQSFAHPLTALVRSLKPNTRTVVGAPLPHVTVSTPVISRAKPVLAIVRTPLPKVTSFRGPQGKWFLASHERWTKPVLALVRSLKPVIRSIVGLPRPHIIPPAASRPFPRLALVRLKPPAIHTYPGSTRVQPSLFNLAIARSPQSTSISSGLSHTGAITLATRSAGIASSNSKTSGIISTNSHVAPIDSGD